MQEKKNQSLSDDYGELMKQAQKQPGIKELAVAYGHYDKLVRQSNAYLGIIRPKFIVNTTNSTS